MTNHIMICTVAFYSFWWPTISGHSSIPAQECSIHTDDQPYRDTHTLLHKSVLIILETNHIRTLTHSSTVAFCSFWWPTILGNSSIFAQQRSIHSDDQLYRDIHPYLHSSDLFILMTSYIKTFIHICTVAIYSFWLPTISGHSLAFYSFWLPTI